RRGARQWPPSLNPYLPATRSKLRSTQILTLLQNSLDAGARQIDIGVDCEEWTCWVRDDGSGMNKEGMDILGTGLEAGRYGFQNTVQRTSRSVEARITRNHCLHPRRVLQCKFKPCRSSSLSSFQQLPVRRLSHPTPTRTLDAIRHQVETFALVFPSVSFTLENTHSVKDDKDMLLRIPKTTSVLTAFRHLYGRAFHVEEIDTTSGELRLKGFISLDGAYSKAHQFLYINRHPISFCELHQAIDSRFASSSFGKHAILHGLGSVSPISAVRRSPRKTEKKPVYVLDLSDNCLEPAKAAVHLRNKGSVMTLLTSTIQSFLVRNGFAAEQKTADMRSGSPLPPLKRRKYDFEDDSGYAEERPEQTTSRLFFDELREASPTPLYTREETEELMWRDPHTGQIYVVDARTGNSYKQSEPPPGATDGTTTSVRQGRTLSRQKAQESEGQMPEWIQKALEEKIPSLRHLQAPDVDAQQHNCNDFHKFSDYLKQDIQDLRNARVIDQVDRKFIACLIDDSGDPNSSRTLVLIDQHAADERVRSSVLGYLSNITADGNKAKLLRLRELNPVRPILVTRHEERQLREFSSHEGGPTVETASGYSQVFVHWVPELVADKLLLDDELRDFVKTFLAKLESDPPATQRRPELDLVADGEEDEFRWLRALRWCPQQLLDLVNSKACRGAIMFNDSLTHAQCRKLVDDLCKTAFPFQCAHGRPSLVPLIDLGSDGVRNRTRKTCRWSSLEKIAVV
ncbi:hypothetical protein C8R46DRAFT_1093418, partial [Mycena filopes]